MRGCLLIHTLLLTAALPGCVRNDSAAETKAAPATSMPPLTAVASTKQLMQAIVIPASDAIFSTAAETPTDDAGWTMVHHQALALAEAGNLLMVNGRRVDQDNWLKFSQQLIATATSAAQAAHDKNADEIMEAGNAVYEVCDGCHQQYMPARAGE